MFTCTIEPRFSGTLPEEDDYNAIDLQALIQQNSADQARISQILLADVRSIPFYHST